MSRAVLGLLAAVALAACATADAKTTTTAPPEPTTTTTSVATTTTAQATTTTLPPEPERMVRTFDVDGVEVIVMSEVDALPEQATRVEFNTMIIDATRSIPLIEEYGGEPPPAGPVACQWAVMISAPPQCFGPVIDGYDISTWAEDLSDVYYGERSVVVTWPPADGHVQLVGDAPGEWLIAVDYPDEGLPHGSTDDLEQLAERLNRQFRDEGGLWGELFVSNANRGPGGRVNVTVAVADIATVKAVAALVDDRSLLRIVGFGVLLADSDG